MTCSDAWVDTALPALGTAPDAHFWVALEQPGPWGAKAFTQSHLDPELGALLERTVQLAGGRMLLVRSPLHHPDQPGPRRVLVAGGPVEAPWLGRCRIDDPTELVALLDEWGDLAVARTPPAPLEAAEPVLLVCTNGKRDRCCATKGAPLARALAARFGDRVWEATHLGGHRFATTALALPARQMTARVDEELAVRALDGKLLALDEQHDRGRTCLPAMARIADAWLRGATGEVDPAALRYETDGQTVHARHRDGRIWTLSVEKRSSQEIEVPESCGKAPVPATWWNVTEA